MIIVLMGAAGAGKTTVGTALAEALGWPFYDADALHDGASVDKMRGGEPLTELDRGPWLVRVHELLRELSEQKTNAVVACSALRARHRSAVAVGVDDVRWIFLQADPELLRARLESRSPHFAGPALLPGQLAALEPPTNALTLPADRSVVDLVEAIIAATR